MDYTDVVLKSEYDKIKEEYDILTSPDPVGARLKNRCDASSMRALKGVQEKTKDGNR